MYKNESVINYYFYISSKAVSNTALHVSDITCLQAEYQLVPEKAHLNSAHAITTHCKPPACASLHANETGRPGTVVIQIRHIFCGLLYHRTTHPSNDPWGIWITTETFLEETLVSTRVFSKYLLFIYNVCVFLLFKSDASACNPFGQISCDGNILLVTHSVHTSLTQTIQQQTIKTNAIMLKTQSEPQKSTC